MSQVFPEKHCQLNMVICLFVPRLPILPPFRTVFGVYCTINIYVKYQGTFYCNNIFEKINMKNFNLLKLQYFGPMTAVDMYHK